MGKQRTNEEFNSVETLLRPFLKNEISLKII